MRFMSVLFLAAVQLTALPFVALLSQNTVRHAQMNQVAIADHNMSIVYKQRSTN